VSYDAVTFMMAFGLSASAA